MGKTVEQLTLRHEVEREREKQVRAELQAATAEVHVALAANGEAIRKFAASKATAAEVARAREAVDGLENESCRPATNEGGNLQMVSIKGRHLGAEEISRHRELLAKIEVRRQTSERAAEAHERMSREQQSSVREAAARAGESLVDYLCKMYAGDAFLSTRDAIRSSPVRHAPRVPVARPCQAHDSGNAAAIVERC